MACNYSILAPSPQSIVVGRWVGSFSVESGGGGSCRYDRVAVREVASNRTKGSFCGEELPQPVSGRGMIPP